MIIITIKHGEKNNNENKRIDGTLLLHVQQRARIYKTNEASFQSNY